MSEPDESGLRRRVLDQTGVHRMPRRLGDFQIDKEIGRSPLSRVYLARDPIDHAAVALKVLYPKEKLDVNRQRSLAQLEARRLRGLSHPNIISVKATGEIGGVPYLSFPYIEGLGLDQVLVRREHSVLQIAEALLSVCGALQHAHERGIIHRDLKPRNIMIEKSGAPMVLDWGLSWRKGEQSEDGVQNIVGTPAYMSPEQARGEEKKLTPATDIYSLGAMLYHVLTGRPPFEADSSWKTLQMVMSLPPNQPGTLTNELDLRLERIALFCLEKDPASRYGSAHTLGADIRRVLDGNTPRGPAAASGLLGRIFGG